MTRLEQIESLAQSWEALGDGRESWWHPKGFDGAKYSTQYFGREATSLRNAIEIKAEATDTQDATPCLALLRDAYGEDVDIDHSRKDLTHYWRVRTLQGYDVGVHGAHSTLSRIHAVDLALKALQGEKK